MVLHGFNPSKLPVLYPLQSWCEMRILYPISASLGGRKIAYQGGEGEDEREKKGMGEPEPRRDSEYCCTRSLLVMTTGDFSPCSEHCKMIYQLGFRIM